ncbi:hypothetical protein [Sinomonas sp. P47F7]|uniref:hypothetical protein n=1 Tax=Sinomonas sp. P47F7 TaxID=3410987 RepID=UPI003BF5CEE8
MSIRDRLAAWSPAPTHTPSYTVREIFPQDHRHRVPRFSALAASVVERGLLVEATEDFLGRAGATAIHAGARFGAVLELVARTADGVLQRGRQTLWTVQTAECQLSADRTGRAAASLTLGAPSLSLILGLIPADPGTEIRLVRASWSELLVSDVEHGVTNRVPGSWTVFDGTSREQPAAAG